MTRVRQAFTTYCDGCHRPTSRSALTIVRFRRLCNSCARRHKK